jgi:3-oxoacyl-[acyl-carrier-protein] synthase II
MTRVVITGIGLRTPLADDPSALFDAIDAGRSGVRSMPEWASVAELRTGVGAPVDGFDGSEIPRKIRRTMGRVAQLAAAAATDAARVAGLDAGLLESGRVGVAVGSTVGSPSAEEAYWGHYVTERSARGVKSTLFFQIMSHTAATHVALALGVTGEVFSTNAACASATQAIGMAMARIQAGAADVMLAGGADELHPTAALTFDVVGGSSSAYNDRPTLTPRPFDRDRDGIVVGEGAGILVLESRDHAVARGAPILAEILGYGTTCDAHHMANPEPQGMRACVRRALSAAGLPPEAIDYVNAHATGTRVGDAAEAEALYDIFGDRCPVSSSKGHLGHLLGACGAVEAAIVVEALRRGRVPATHNLEHPDVHPLWLPAAPIDHPMETVLSTNFAFGGINAALVLRR